MKRGGADSRQDIKIGCWALVSLRSPRLCYCLLVISSFIITLNFKASLPITENYFI